jgi:hypothetical protein
LTRLTIPSSSSSLPLSPARSLVQGQQAATVDSASMCANSAYNHHLFFRSDCEEKVHPKARRHTYLRRSSSLLPSSSAARRFRAHDKALPALPRSLSRRSAACCHCGCVLGRKFSVSLSPAVLSNRLLRNLSLSAPCLVREVELRFYARISSIRHTPCTCSFGGCGGRSWRPRISCTGCMYVCMYCMSVCM